MKDAVMDEDSCRLEKFFHFGINTNVPRISKIVAGYSKLMVLHKMPAPAAVAMHNLTYKRYLKSNVHITSAMLEVSF